MTRLHHDMLSWVGGAAVAGAGLVLAIVSATPALAQSGSSPMGELGDADRGETQTGQAAPLRLMVGPIPGFTTTAHEAPSSLVLPQGAQVPFRIEGLAPDETILWDSAYAVSAAGAAATVGVDALAPAMVSATILPSGERFECVVTPMAVTPESLTFTPRAVAPTDTTVHEGMTNEQAVGAYFGPALSEVREVAPGTFATSVARAIMFEAGAVYASPRAAAAAPADLDGSGYVDAGDLLGLLGGFGSPGPGDLSGDGSVGSDDLLAMLASFGADVRSKGLESLVEWRLWGQPMDVDRFDRMFSYAGEQRIEVGPPSATREVKLILFDVSIDSEQVVDGFIPDNIPVTFTATTDPPGFEEQVDWLAATKFGDASPMTGQGETFTTTFTGTFGSAMRWVGVKAANTRAGGDTTPTTIFFDSDGSGPWTPSGPGWTIGASLSELGNDPDFAGSQALADILASEGADNLAIWFKSEDALVGDDLFRDDNGDGVVDAGLSPAPFGTIELSALSFPVSADAAAGRAAPQTINLTFRQNAQAVSTAQLGVNATANGGTAVIFDNIELAWVPEQTGIRINLWMKLHLLMKITQPSKVWTFHKDVKPDGTIFNVFHTGTQNVTQTVVVHIGKSTHASLLVPFSEFDPDTGVANVTINSLGQAMFEPLP